LGGVVQAILPEDTSYVTYYFWVVEIYLMSIEIKVDRVYSRDGGKILQEL
jgi:hypothetical protein